MKENLLLSLLLLLFNISNNVVAQTSDLGIEVLVDNASPYVMSTIKFTITITNYGPDVATGVSIFNELSNGYGEITSITNEGIKAGNTITWPELTIDSNSNIFLHFNARVLSRGMYNNKTEIIASDNYDPNSDPETSFDNDDFDDGYIDDDEYEMTSVTPILLNFDNDSVFNRFDIDDDNDGIPDLLESNNVNPDADFDADGTPVYLDDNDDNFDIGDINDAVETFFDFDNDSIPNHLDYDSDGDGILDVYESGHKKNIEVNEKGEIQGVLLDFGVNGLFNDLETSFDNGTLIHILLNTDNDNAPNFLDFDDDNDGVLTIDEEPDPNGDGNPDDARDSNSDGIPDFLDYENSDPNSSIKESFSIDQSSSKEKTVTITDKNYRINIKLFTANGIEITPDIKRVGNLVQLDISNLESGVYFIQFKTGNKIDIKRMVID